MNWTHLVATAALLGLLSFLVTIGILTWSNWLDQRNSDHLRDALTGSADETEFVRDCCFSFLTEGHRSNCPTWGDMPKAAA